MVEQANQVEDVEVVTGEVITSEEDAKTRVEEIVEALNKSMTFQKLEIAWDGNQAQDNQVKQRNFYYEVTDPDQFLTAYQELETLAKDVPIAQAAYQKIKWEGDPQMGQEALKREKAPVKEMNTMSSEPEIIHVPEPDDFGTEFVHSDTVEKKFKEVLANMTNRYEASTNEPLKKDPEKETLPQQEVKEQEEIRNHQYLEKELESEEEVRKPYEIFTQQELSKEIATLKLDIEQIELELKILQEDISHLPEEGSELQKHPMEMKIQELGLQREGLKQNLSDKLQVFQALYPEETRVQEKPELEPITQDGRTEEMAFSNDNKNDSQSYSKREDSTALIPAKKHNKFVQFFINMKDKLLGKEKMTSVPATKMENAYHENLSQDMREELIGATNHMHEIGNEAFEFVDTTPKREKEERGKSR